MSAVSTAGTGRLRQSATVAGIALATLGFAIFTAMDTTIKWLSQGLPLVEIVFFNALFALVPIAAMASRAQGWRTLRTQRPGLQAARGVVALAGSLASFFAYSRMPLADAYAIAFSAPLFITALSVPVLGESVGWRRWSAVTAGFLGVLVMLRPGVGVIGVGALGALGGALCYAVSMLIVRRAGAAESNVAFACYTNLVAVVATGLVLPFGFVAPQWSELALLAAAGLGNGVALTCLLGGFQRAPAAVVAPFQYSQMIWGLITGFLIWGDLPDAWFAVGGGVVIASGIYIVHRETRRNAPLVGEAVPRPGGPARASAES